MADKFEHSGQEYWVTVTAAIDPDTNEGTYVAFVADREPDGMIYGKQVNQPNGKPMFFANKFSALTNASAVKQAEIDSKPKK